MKIKVNDEKFKKVLKERGVTKTYLCQQLNISTRTMAKISNGREINNVTALRITDYLHCSLNDIYDRTIIN